MKKSVILAVIGLSAAAVSSFGQGSISFNSYNAGSSGSTKIKFLASGLAVPTSAGLVADILYSLTPITEGAGNGALNPGWSTSETAPSINSMITPIGNGGAGYFTPVPNFTLNPYTAGSTVYFEVIGYLASAGSYANSLADRGHSASFSFTLATGQNLPVDATYGSWTIAPVPEPTTLALAGLGGLASLIALRRKQA